jgi:hypothetical protein
MSTSAYARLMRAIFAFAAAIVAAVAAVAAVVVARPAHADLVTPSPRDAAAAAARCRVLVAKVKGAVSCHAGTMSLRFGELTLPDGWVAVDVRGVDSRPGALYDARDVVRARYDIGAMAGTAVPAAPAAPAVDDRGFRWVKQETIAGHALRYGARERRVVFTIDPVTNFFCDARDLDALLAIFRTLRPAPP